MTSFAPLFSKGRFGKIETKNRIAMHGLRFKPSKYNKIPLFFVPKP